jgi:hypothetical protein
MQQNTRFIHAAIPPVVGQLSNILQKDCMAMNNKKHSTTTNKEKDMTQQLDQPQSPPSREDGLVLQ